MDKMETEFQITLSFDTADDRREAFIDAVRDAAQLLYTQAALLSSFRPVISITATDNRNGIVKIPVFERGQ